MPLDPSKRLTWQAENCLSCKWFRPTDPLNADILMSGRCVHKDLLKFDLIVSGRDWCNVFEQVTEKQIEAMQAKAMEKE
jgi:hypothetical protein